MARAPCCHSDSGWSSSSRCCSSPCSDRRPRWLPARPLRRISQRSPPRTPRVAYGTEIRAPWRRRSPPGTEHSWTPANCRGPLATSRRSVRASVACSGWGEAKGVRGQVRRLRKEAVRRRTSSVGSAWLIYPAWSARVALAAATFAPVREALRLPSSASAARVASAAQVGGVSCTPAPTPRRRGFSGRSSHGRP